MAYIDSVLTAGVIGGCAIVLCAVLEAIELNRLEIARVDLIRAQCALRTAVLDMTIQHEAGMAEMRAIVARVLGDAP